MKSYAHNRERLGPLPYLVQSAPRRRRDLDWSPTFRMAVVLAVLWGAGWVFLKLIGAS